MNYDYKYHLLEQLTTELRELQEEIGLSDFNFTIEEEQDFIKRRDYNPDTIYIVIKYLTDTKQIGATVQPLQLLILTEQGSLEVTKILFDRFSDNNNWHVYTSNNIYVKQQYSQPVVLSNFNPALYGYRSVMYVSATLFVMDNYVDVSDLTIDGVSIEPINFSLTYTMSTNTQQKQGNNLSTSEKNVSTLAIAIAIPPIYSTLITKVRNSIKGYDSGNDNYSISFKLKISDDYAEDSLLTYEMKLTSAMLISAPNQVPSWQLGFIL